MKKFITTKNRFGKKFVFDIEDLKAFVENDTGTTLLFYSNEKLVEYVSDNINEIIDKIHKLNNL